MQEIKAAVRNTLSLPYNCYKGMQKLPYGQIATIVGVLAVTSLVDLNVRNSAFVQRIFRACHLIPYGKQIFLTVALAGSATATIFFLTMCYLQRPIVKGRLKISYESTGPTLEDRKFNFSKRIQLKKEGPYLELDNDLKPLYGIEKNDYYIKLSGNLVRGAEHLAPLLLNGHYYLPSSLVKQVSLQSGSPILRFYFDGKSVELLIPNYETSKMGGLYTKEASDNERTNREYLFIEDMPENRKIRFLDGSYYLIPSLSTQLHPARKKNSTEYDFAEAKNDQEGNGLYRPIQEFKTFEIAGCPVYRLKVDPVNIEINDVRLLKTDDGIEKRFWIFIPHRADKKTGLKSMHHGFYFRTAPFEGYHGANPKLVFKDRSLYLYLEETHADNPIYAAPATNSAGKKVKVAQRLKRSIPSPIQAQIEIVDQLPVYTFFTEGNVFTGEKTGTFKLEDMRLCYEKDGDTYTLRVLCKSKLWVRHKGGATHVEELVDTIVLSRPPSETPYLAQTKDGVGLFYKADSVKSVD